MTSPTAARRRPPGRYDDPPLLGQRVLAVLLAVTVVVFAVALARFAYDRYGGEQVRGTVRTFEILSDSALTMELDVAKTAGAKAYCVIRARGADGLEVGRDIAVVDAVGTQDERVRGTFRLATERRAVTAELFGCTPDVISRDDPAP